MKKLYIIHGWGATPEEPWYQWLKGEMETNGWSVIIPAMPNSENPKIETWVSYLSELVKTPDPETYFVGHSIGVQTILRYLEQLPEGLKIGGVVSVAGWFTLNKLEGPAEEAIAKPWLETPIDFEQIRTHSDKFVAIFSNNDPFVPLDNKDLFVANLNAETKILLAQEHFGAEDNVVDIPAARDALLSL
jgi:predicted alpha/beta hydrolase family esterase